MKIKIINGRGICEKYNITPLILDVINQTEDGEYEADIVTQKLINNEWITLPNRETNGPGNYRNRFKVI